LLDEEVSPFHPAVLAEAGPKGFEKTRGGPASSDQSHPTRASFPAGCVSAVSGAARSKTAKNAATLVIIGFTTILRRQFATFREPK
jgi:hypothetical protein